MASWFIERVLPGIVTSALWMPVWTLALWWSHRKLRRHVDTVTERQTATLSGREPQTPGGAS